MGLWVDLPILSRGIYFDVLNNSQAVYLLVLTWTFYIFCDIIESENLTNGGPKMEFFGLVFLAVVVEGLITYAKMAVVDKAVQWQVVASIVLGVLVAVVYDCDLFALFDLSASLPFVGNVLTGVLLSRGANYISDLVKTLTGLRDPGGDSAES